MVEQGRGCQRERERDSESESFTMTFCFCSWLYNLFSGTIADGLKGSIEGSVRTA